MKYISQPQLNKFSVLNVKEYTENNSELSNIYIYILPLQALWPILNVPSRKKLSIYPTISALNVCSIFLYLLISLKTTNTIKTVFI